MQGVHGWPGSITSSRVSLSRPQARLGLWGCVGVGGYRRQLKAVVKCRVKRCSPEEAALGDGSQTWMGTERCHFQPGLSLLLQDFLHP